MASTHSTEPLQLIHSDVHGPLPVRSRHHARYWITFIDDFSRFWAVLPLKDKSGALDAFKQFKALAENQLNRKIKALRDDKGGEYMSLEWEAFCAEHGIHRQHTVRAEPHQNGVAERANRTIMEHTIALLNEAKLPGSFWWDALSAYAHVRNCSPTAALSSGTPYEHWHGSKPDVSHFRVFGCTAYVHIKKDKRAQLQPHTEKCVFIGYPSNYKAWLFWNPATKKTVISNSAEFDERYFPGNSTNPINWPVDVPSTDLPQPQPLVEQVGGSGDDSVVPPFTLRPATKLEEPADVPLPQAPPPPAPEPSRPKRPLSSPESPVHVRQKLGRRPPLVFAQDPSSIRSTMRASGSGSGTHLQGTRSFAQALAPLREQERAAGPQLSEPIQLNVPQQPVEDSDLALCFLSFFSCFPFSHVPSLVPDSFCP